MAENRAEDAREGDSQKVDTRLTVSNLIVLCSTRSYTDSCDGSWMPGRHAPELG